MRGKSLNDLQNLIKIFQQLLTGEMCCFDTAAADQWKHGHEGWKKKCCNNPTGSPVIRPTGDLDDREIKKVGETDDMTVCFSF